VQVLTPMNRGSSGARALNALLQDTLNPQAEPRISRFGCSYAPGDKVIQTVNNYEKDVFNGDIGQVTQVDPDHGVVVDIEWRLVTYEFGELDEVALAYTATVHKSQGSEYLAVIIGQPRALGLAVRTVKSRRRLSN
jgi:exodeoxyribonuclease V alpha subunit